jgi:hypothetical protein
MIRLSLQHSPIAKHFIQGVVEYELLLVVSTTDAHHRRGSESRKATWPEVRSKVQRTATNSASD